MTMPEIVIPSLPPTAQIIAVILLGICIITTIQLFLTNILIRVWPINKLVKSIKDYINKL